MKREVLYVAVFGVLCVLAGVLVGAGIVKKGIPHAGPRLGGPGFAERSERFAGRGLAALKERKGKELFEKIAAELSLNEQQRIQVKGILENARQEIDKVGEDMHSAINEIREKSDKQIMGVLAAEQQDKFQALLKKHGMNGRGPHRPGKDRGPGQPGEDHGPMDGPGAAPDEGMPPPG